MSPSGLGWCCVVHGMCAGSEVVHDVAIGHGPTMEIYVSARWTSSRYLRSRKGQPSSATEGEGWVKRSDGGIEVVKSKREQVNKLDDE